MTIVGSARLARILPIMATRVSSPVVVGRDAELHTIESALDRAAGGEAVHLLVAGEAGVGKTRLTSEAARLAGDRGFRVLRGDCGNVGGSSLPYGPFVEALRNLAIELGPAETAAVAGPAARDLTRLVPAFGSLEDAPHSRNGCRPACSRRSSGCSGGLAERSPVLLIVEDLHWADTATRETIAYLVRLAAGRARSCSSARSAATSSTAATRCCRGSPNWIAGAASSGSTSPASIARRWRRCSRRSSARSRTTSSSARCSAVRTATRSSPRSCSLRAGRARAGPRLPPTLREILAGARRRGARNRDRRPARRRGRRPSRRARVARRGRRPARGRTARRTPRRGRRAISSSSRSATASSAMRSATRWSRRSCTTSCCPASGATCIAPSPRRSTHERPSAARPRRAAGPNWRTTGPPPARTTVRSSVSLRAAEAAMGSYAFGAALVEYERALGLWDDVDDPERVAGFDRVELLRKAGSAAYLAADYRRAVARGARRPPWRDRGRPTRSAQGSCARSWDAACGSSATAAARSRRTARRSRSRRPTGLPPSGRGPSRARPDPDAGRSLRRNRAALCQEAIAIARQVDARAQEGHALNSYGRDLTLLGTCADGMVAIREALEIGRETRTSDDIGRAYVNLVESFYDCGVTSEAIEVAAEGIRTSDELGIGRPVRPLHPAQRSDLRVRARALGPRPDDGPRRPSPECPPAGVPSCTASPTPGPVRRGRQLRPRRRRAGPRVRPAPARPRARSSSGRSTPPQRNVALWRHRPRRRWRWPNAARLDGVHRGLRSRRCGSAASPPGRPRTWPKPLGRRGTAARSTTRVSELARIAARLDELEARFAGADGWSRAGRQQDDGGGRGDSRRRPIRPGRMACRGRGMGGVRAPVLRRVRALAGGGGGARRRRPDRRNRCAAAR